MLPSRDRESKYSALFVHIYCRAKWHLELVIQKAETEKSPITHRLASQTHIPIIFCHFSWGKLL